MSRSRHLYICIAIGLSMLLGMNACHRHPVQLVKGEYYEPVESGKIAADEGIEAIIYPYREELAERMDEVICVSETDFLRIKGEKETVLGDFVADLCLARARALTPTPIDMCLLNFGGLRHSIGAGEVTVGDVYSLMPFDNELVIVTLSSTEVDSLTTYLARVGGQPVSGLRMTIDDGRASEVMIGGEYKADRSYTILTSDYLATGGDQMRFLTEGRRSGYATIGLKVRDAILEHCRGLTSEGRTIQKEKDGRIR